MSRPLLVTGRVRTFDDERGLGTVEAEDGTELPFHCTAVADGSRHIDPGTPVVCSLTAGHGGRMEAGAVTAVLAAG